MCTRHASLQISTSDLAHACMQQEHDSMYKQHYIETQLGNLENVILRIRNANNVYKIVMQLTQ